MKKLRSILLSLLSFLLSCLFVQAQDTEIGWYSESVNNGIRIQNSFPKGGPYLGQVKNHVNYSYLVFFTRVMNESEKEVELNLTFSTDSAAIPHSPDTYMKLFLPAETMSFDKVPLFSYGIPDLKLPDTPTRFHKILSPQEDVLFYVVAIFYQTKEEAWRQERGGNRAELLLEGQDFFYRMLPQVDSYPCGYIEFD